MWCEGGRRCGLGCHWLEVLGLSGWRDWWLSCFPSGPGVRGGARNRWKSLMLKELGVISGGGFWGFLKFCAGD